MDYAWLAADERAVGHCNRLLAFFHQANASAPYGNQYDVTSGRQLSADHSPGLVSMNAVCALASNTSLAWEFVADLWATPTPSGKYRYYDGMLYMLGWLQLSANFRYYGANATHA
jgi:oligosaccharide reducing-end xylanase